MQDWQDIRYNGANDEVGRLKMYLQFYELAGKAFQAINRAADQIRHMHKVDDKDAAFGQRYYDATIDELNAFRAAYRNTRANLAEMLKNQEVDS